MQFLYFASSESPPKESKLETKESVSIRAVVLCFQTKASMELSPHVIRGDTFGDKGRSRVRASRKSGRPRGREIIDEKT